MSKNLIVNNIPFQSDKTALQDIFKPFEGFISLELALHQNNKSLQGIVSFGTTKQAEFAQGMLRRNLPTILKDTTFEIIKDNIPINNE